MAGDTINRLFFWSAALAMVLSFSAWVLSASSIKKHNFGFDMGSKGLPIALLILGLLSWMWFLLVVVLGRTRSVIFRAKNVLIGSTLAALALLGVAIAYAAKKNTACPNGQFAGCYDLYIAITVIAFVAFGFAMLAAIFCFLLAKKHAKLPWTNRENGMNVPVGRLCPVDNRSAAQKDEFKH